VHYYEKTGVSGTFSYAGFRSANWDETLGHYVGAFLIPPGVSVTNIVPEIYELIPDISAVYSAPARDALMWDETPSTFNEATFDASTWTGFRDAINAASPGDTVVIQDGTYSADGNIEITAAGTAATPIICRPQTPGGGVLTGTTTIRIMGSAEYLVIEGFHFSGSVNNSRDLLRNVSGSKWITYRNIKFSNIPITQVGRRGIRVQGEYTTVHNVDIDNWAATTQCISVLPATEGVSTDCRYNRIHHVDAFDHTGSTGGGANEVFQLGGNSNDEDTPDATIMNGMCDHNRVYNWNQTGETEVIGNKSQGWVIANNLISDSDGDISMRMAASYLTFANRFFNTVSKYDNNRAGVLNGKKDDTSDAVHALNWTDYMSSVNGFWNPLEVGDTATSRWAANRTLTVGDIVVNGDDQPFKTGTVGVTNERWAANLRYEGCSSYVTTDAFNLGAGAIQGDWTFSGCVIYGTTADAASPSGNTYEDPVMSDRGDGISVPTHVNISYGINNCFPGRLEGGAIANVGATW
jgi:hypothetical protein